MAEIVEGLGPSAFYNATWEVNRLEKMHVNR